MMLIIFVDDDVQKLTFGDSEYQEWCSARKVYEGMKCGLAAFYRRPPTSGSSLGNCGARNWEEVIVGAIGFDRSWWWVGECAEMGVGEGVFF